LATQRFDSSRRINLAHHVCAGLGEQPFRVLTATEIQAEVIGWEITGTGGALASPIDTVPGFWWMATLSRRSASSPPVSALMGSIRNRAATKLYVANRGSHKARGAPRGPGSIAVINFHSRRVETTWPIPGGGSPDMGNLSADGKRLWLSGRFDNVAYAIDTTTGAVSRIPVGREPHGLTVWPQPGRYSLGHTGNMR
jgi:DNA-binding beta-propeller fold protein YncE